MDPDPDGENVIAMEYNVATSNSFNALSSNSESQTTAMPAGRTLRPERPATLTIAKELTSKLANIASLAGLYSIKRTQTGDIELFPSNTEAERKIRAEFATNEVEYHTRDRNRVYKYVVYGLHRMDPDLLPAEISKATNGRCTAASAKQMVIKAPKYIDQTNYIIYFNVDPTLVVLKEVKLFNTIVSWRHYESRRTGPTRCTNCQMWGHGAFGCRRKPKCVACAGPHKSSECPLLIKKRSENCTALDKKFLKCANCGDNHTASFTSCPNYPKVPTRQMNNRNPSRPPPPPPEIADRGEFPSLPGTSKSQTTFNNIPQYSSRQSSQQNSQQSSQQDLFSIQEIQVVLAEIMSELKKCRNKEQQFNVMFSLAAKYVYNS